MEETEEKVSCEEKKPRCSKNGRKLGRKKKPGRKPLPKKRGRKPKPKKRGRKKKPGPKVSVYQKRKRREEKRRKLLEVKEKPLYANGEYKFKVVMCLNGTQKKMLARFRSEPEAREYINGFLEEQSGVIFKREVVSARSLKPSVNEIVLLEKNKNEGKKNAMIRNEFGKVVEHKTTNDLWVIVDKFPYDIEETFHVWGYESKFDRKTFEWIYENILLGKRANRFDIKRVFLYKNKILIKNDTNKMDLIICKCVRDSVRLYIMCSDWVKRDKVGYVFFMGNYGDINFKDRKKKIEKEISKLTGWSVSLVQKCTSRVQYSEKEEEEK